MLILLRGGPFGETVIDDDDPVDVLIVNNKHFYRRTRRNELVEVKKGWQETATIYEIDFRLGSQSIQWDLIFPPVNS